MKYFFYLIFISYLSYGQNYKLTYEITKYFDIKINKDLTPTQEKIVKGWKKDFKNFGENLKIEVIANKKSYFYKLNQPLNSKRQNPYKRPAILGKLGVYENVFFKEGVAYYYYYISDFVTKSNPDNLKWKITKNKKVINGYECYEAKPILKDNFELGYDDNRFRVWFSPDINIIGGPTIFGNLPGLIVALENMFVRFELKSIKETSKNIITLKNFVSDKKIYSYEEAQNFYNKMGKIIENK